MPVTRYKPTLHNPFVGNMRSVAVLPFENLTGNERFDGREFADHFSIELQKIPGFRVISNKIVEETMWEHELHKFESVDDIRYLAQLLKVDAVVVGKVYNFNMNYPPLTRFETAWYHVNPYLHPALEGYALPWGTEHERFIPDKIVLLAEMNVAEAQIRTQTPDFEPIERRRPVENDFDEYGRIEQLVPPRQARRELNIRQMGANMQTAATIPNNLRVESTDENHLQKMAQHQQDLAISRQLATTGVPLIPESVPATAREQRDFIVRHDLNHPLKHGPWPSESNRENQLPWSQQNIYPAYQQGMHSPGMLLGQYPGVHPGMHPNMPQEMMMEMMTEHGMVALPIMPVPPMYSAMPGMPVEGQYGHVMGEPDRFPGLPGDWPDPRGLIPEGPKPHRPVGREKNEGPIISWINVYNGNDSEFMQALQDYDLLFRDDKRLNGTQTILSNRNEFMAFCCRMHIWEIFSARGGAGPAQKVTRTWKPWQSGERPY